MPKLSPSFQALPAQGISGGERLFCLFSNSLRHLCQVLSLLKPDSGQLNQTSFLFVLHRYFVHSPCFLLHGCFHLKDTQLSWAWNLEWEQFLMVGKVGAASIFGDTVVNDWCFTLTCWLIQQWLLQRFSPHPGT